MLLHIILSHNRDVDFKSWKVLPKCARPFFVRICYTKNMIFVAPIRNFYGRFERPISSLSLILGFVFDILTLKRVDTLWENTWIFGHIIIVGIFIILIHIKESAEGDERNPDKIHFWYVNILQFFFGGLLSTYLVFYFRSTDIFVTWPFIALLVIAFIANESFKKHYVRLSFQVSLFFLSVYSFAIFLIPVLIHKIGIWVFLASGLVSLVFIFIFSTILFYFIKNKFFLDNKDTKKTILISVLSIFTLVNILYFTNLIPPIPLSLKDAGMYHFVQRNSTGNYDVTFEDKGWRRYFQLYPDFSQVNGTPIYAFSAIFSPKDLNLVIVHEWQHYNESRGKWITSSVINLPVVGGRDIGFRTYSMRSNLEAGKWRVNIETQDGHIIGRLRFNLITSDIEPVLSNTIK